jgi:hypothetical protein
VDGVDGVDGGGTREVQCAQAWHDIGVEEAVRNRPLHQVLTQHSCNRRSPLASASVHQH